MKKLIDLIVSHTRQCSRQARNTSRDAQPRSIRYWPTACNGRTVKSSSQPGLEVNFSPSTDFLEVVHRSQCSMRRLIIIGLRTRVQMVNPLFGDTQSSKESIIVSTSFSSTPLSAEIVAQNFQLRRIFTLRRKQVQIQSTALANHLDVVTFMLAHLPCKFANQA